MKTIDTSSIELPLSHHLEELRRLLLVVITTLLLAMGVLFVFREPLLTFLTSQASGVTFLLLSPLEGVMISCKVSFWGGLLVSSPLWLLSLLRFLTPALQGNEKRWVFPLAIASMGMLLVGVAGAFLVTLPWASDYLIAFNKGLGSNAWALGAYVDFVLFLLLGHAIVSQFAILLFLLTHTGVLTASTLAEKRRHFIVIAFVAGAILTPPDVLTQCMMAIPAVILYEVAILYSRLRSRKE